MQFKLLAFVLRGNCLITYQPLRHQAIVYFTMQMAKVNTAA